MVGLLIGLSEDLVDDLACLIRSIEFEGDRGKRLATADRHIAPSQGEQILLQLQQFVFAVADLCTNGVQLGIRATNFGITIADVLAEALTLRFEATGLLLQRLQRASQFAGTGLRVSQGLPSFDFIAAGLLSWSRDSCCAFGWPSKRCGCCADAPGVH